MHSVIVIPALNPSPNLASLVKSLLDKGAPHILVVDDGSGNEYKETFQQIAQLENCTLLIHPVNRGKGRALKTAIAYFLEHFPHLEGIITADADGQHSAKDICKIADRLSENQSAIILGTRDFSAPNVPRRSYLGNRTTSWVFQLLYGSYLKDTQTGLRGLPAGALPWMADLVGERFDYEINVLIEAKRRHTPIVEEPIQTIYYDNNSGSHYNSFQDSFRIFLRLISGFIRYTLSSSASAIIDISTFVILNSVVLIHMPVAKRLLIATVSARVISSICNFVLNKNLVFRNGNRIAISVAKYYTLWFFQLLSSYGLIYAASTLLNGYVAFMKIIIDLGLAVISYQIQLHWVFTGKIK